ncbi:ATP-binding protein, partial [Streptomyces rubiginosohelvolus]
MRSVTAPLRIPRSPRITSPTRVLVILPTAAAIAVVVRRWTRHPRCVALARTDLRKALAGWGLVAVEEVALLVLSELITNAVRHARLPGRQIETHYLHQGDKVRLEVHDAADQLPKLRTPTPESVRGRGLTLVETLHTAGRLDPE